MNTAPTMNAETLAALRGSIAKWRAIVAGTGVDHGVDNCPLCNIFCHGINNCGGCPVALAALDDGCRKTPYVPWAALFGGEEFPHRATTERQKAAAQAELDFLISLMPPGVEP